jgi:hypothetical protein
MCLRTLGYGFGFLFPPGAARVPGMDRPNGGAYKIFMRFASRIGKLKERMVWIEALDFILFRWRGQNAAASAQDRRACVNRRGQMTHAGLAAMAVAARLGPA